MTDKTVLMDSISDLFHECVAAAFDKQLRLNEAIGDCAWEFDKPAGLLTFTKPAEDSPAQWRIPVQILGTESETTRTWLWAWANPGSDLPEAIVEAALSLRQFGEEQNFEEFTIPELEEDVLNGHQVGLLSSVLIKPSSGYYRCPYEGGAMFALLLENPSKTPVQNPILRITTVFPELISAFELDDYPLAFSSYCRFYELEVEEAGNIIKGRSERFGSVTARFDEDKRMTNLESEMKP